MKIPYADIDAWVEKFSRPKALAFWEGWNLIIATKNPAAFFKTDGRMIDGEWYRTFTITPDERGEYEIPRKYATRR